LKYVIIVSFEQHYVQLYCQAHCKRINCLSSPLQNCSCVLCLRVVKTTHYGKVVHTMLHCVKTIQKVGSPRVRLFTSRPTAGT